VSLGLKLKDRSLEFIHEKVQGKIELWNYVGDMKTAKDVSSLVMGMIANSQARPRFLLHPASVFTRST